MTKELEYIDKRIQYVKNLAKPVEYKIPVAPQPIKVVINHEAAFEEEIQTLNAIKATLLKAEKLEKAWEVVKEYQVDIWLLKQCDYENYIRIRKEALVSTGQIVNENGEVFEDEIPQQEFNFIKEIVK